MRLPVTTVAALSILLLVAARSYAQTEPEAQSPPTPARAEDADRSKPKSEGGTSEDAIKARGCPAVEAGFDAETDESKHPTPDVPADRALVYVLRPTMLGHKIQSKLAIDGQWVGVNRGHNYFFVMLEPGEHAFCSKAENTSVLALRTEAGQTYFLEQKIKMGFLKARNSLALLSEKEGREKLADCHPSVFKRKDD